MYIPDTSNTFNPLFLSAPTLPPNGARFTLDVSGVIGLLGGDGAVSAMTTAHIYRGRRWLGWYNSPGSYQIARRYGLLAKSRFFTGFFPGGRISPATLFELDGWKGPRFIAAHSGTILPETGHTAALLMKQCAALEGEKIDGRGTQSIQVTIAELQQEPASRVPLPRQYTIYALFAVFPIGVSVGTCMACWSFGDLYSFSAIVLGILANGLSCLCIGSLEFTFNHPQPAGGSPAGDGILGSDNDIVLLRGPEGAVNSITRGRFSLEFPGQPQYGVIGWCSVLLAIQFIAQLLLIPQGTLCGQIMFVTSLAISWVYNAWLSSMDREKIQRDILCHRVLKPLVLQRKYIFSTYTTMVVFALLVLKPEEPRKSLNELLPNDTKVWKRWKETIVGRLLDDRELMFVELDWTLDDFDDDERSLLKNLYGDAQIAYRTYTNYPTVEEHH